MNKTKIDLPFPPIEGSPLHNISKDSPPTIIFVGTEDNLIPIKTMEDYNHKMKKVGSICEVVFYDIKFRDPFISRNPNPVFFGLNN